jgi:hypothetical protein
VKRVRDVRDMPLSFDVPTAGREFAGLSERSSYTAAHKYLESDGREGLPCLRIGGRLVCPTGLLLRWFGFDVDVAEGSEAQAESEASITSRRRSPGAS